MGNTNKVVIGIAVVVIVLLGIWWSGKGDQTSGNTFKIGYIGPLSGEGAIYGEPIRNGALLAVEEINKAGGVKGKQLEFIVEDAKCNGKDAASAVQKLVNVDNVKVIIGGSCSSETLAAVPIVTSAKVALLSPAASSPALTDSSPLFARDYPSDSAQGKVLAELSGSKGWKKVAVIQEQLDYPLGIYNAFKQNFEPSGGTIIKEEFPAGTTDFRSLLTKLRAQNPDVLFIDPQTSAPADRILKQLRDLNWKPVLLINDVVIGDPKVVKDNAGSLEGVIGAEFIVDRNNSEFQKFFEDYKARFGMEPAFQSYTVPSYDAVYLVRDAITKVGYDGPKIAKWLKTVKDWQGASGSITIGSNGDRVGGHSLEIVKNGKVELYR